MIKPMNKVEVSREDREVQKWSQSWLCFKIIKCIVIFICLIMLPLNSTLYRTEDDFTVVGTNSNSTTTHNLHEKHQNNNRNNENKSDHDNKHESVKRQTETLVAQTRALHPLNSANSHKHQNPKTRLSDLLVMYPCCTTVVIILGMELGGQALKDPLTKWPISLSLLANSPAILLSLLEVVWKPQHNSSSKCADVCHLFSSNFILSFLCLLLACITFIMSLMSIMRHVQAVMIVICILSMLFLILEAVDISLSLMP